jgi:dTDP-4-amino-4,6-dideoxygalactose transaminase
MEIPFVDLKAQYLLLKNDIDLAIENVIKDTAFIGGKYVEEFESNFSKVYNVKHCISVANGTDSLFIVMKMLGIGQGDEVITVANSWISTSETISLTGARPVFVDIDCDFYTIDETLLEKAISPKTKAIIPVHLYGQACNMELISTFASKYNLYVIEDCAQAHFSEFKGNRVGTWGVAGSFSFYPGKNLGAYGDAGCIITNDDELAIKCRMFARHGALKKHQHMIEGINSRMDGLQAAILSAKLPFILKWTEQRIINSTLYYNFLSSIPEIVLPKVRNDSKHTFHLFVIRAQKRDELIEFLKRAGIETAIHYPIALPNMEAYNYLDYKKNDFPNATKYQQEIISLPMYPELTIVQIEYICNTIKSFYN